MSALQHPLLDLSERPSARRRDFRSGASVWYREDIRLDDGRSRVVPAVFAGFNRRHTRCQVVRGLTDRGLTPPLWVSLDDVFARHWADDADERPRLALAPLPVDAPPAGLPALLVAVSIAGVLGFFALALWWGFVS